MNQYKELVKDVLDNGYDSGDRTGTGTKSVFGRQVRFDLSKGFPMVTTKKTYWKGVLVELLWLMRGETNVKFLQDRGVKIWDEAVKNTLAKMPKNQETLSIIEAELETVVANMPGDSSREQWHNFTQGINLIIGANVNDRKQAEGAIKTLEQDELSIDIDKDLD